jgi:hypothetical protein
MRFLTEDSELGKSISFRRSTAQKIATFCLGVGSLKYALRVKGLWILETRETKKSVHQDWVPNPSPHAGIANIPESIPNPQSRTTLLLGQY